MCFTLYYYAPHWCAVVTFCHSGRLYYNRHSKTHYASKNMVCRNTLLDWTCTEAAIISVYNTLLYNMLTLLYHTSTSNWYTCWKNSMVIAKNMQTVMSQEVFSKPPIYAHCPSFLSHSRHLWLLHLSTAPCCHNGRPLSHGLQCFAWLLLAATTQCCSGDDITRLMANKIQLPQGLSRSTTLQHSL